VYDRKKLLFDLLLLTAILIWGVNFAVLKLAYRAFHPIAFNAVRFAISSATLILLMRSRGMSFRIDRTDWTAMLRLGFVSHTVYQFLFILGVDRTRAANASLIMALTPVFAYLISVWMRRERFSPGVLSGIVLSLAGVSTIVLFGSSGIELTGTWRGDLMLIAAAFCWGWYSVESSRLLPKYGPLRLTVLTIIIGSVLLIPLSIPWVLQQDWSGVPISAWLCLVYSALLSIVYAYWIWAYALSRIGIAHTSVFNNLTPIVALLAGWFMLGERPFAAQLAGVFLVITGVFMVRSRKPTFVPDE
jgi:drug/metabolite transporter (DMT)-like permease